MITYNCEPQITKQHWINMKLGNQIDLLSMYSVYIMCCKIPHGSFRFSREEFQHKIQQFIRNPILSNQIMHNTTIVLDHYFEINELSKDKTVIGIW